MNIKEVNDEVNAGATLRWTSIPSSAGRSRNTCSRLIDPLDLQENPGYVLTMEFDGHEVKSLDYLKILVVTIDNKLTFSEHISNVCKKTSCKVGALLRLRNLGRDFVLNIFSRGQDLTPNHGKARPKIMEKHICAPYNCIEICHLLGNNRAHLRKDNSNKN